MLRHTKITLAATLLATLAAPVARAQDSTVADALARVTGAMAACTLAVSDPKAATTLLQDAGWLAQPAEAGEVIFADTADAATFATMADQGGDCSVSTTVSGTADVMKNFFDTTDALGWPAFDWADDSGQGCLTASLDAALAVAITGTDGTCPSPDTATITFTAPQ